MCRDGITCVVFVQHALRLVSVVFGTAIFISLYTCIWKIAKWRTENESIEGESSLLPYTDSYSM